MTCPHLIDRGLRLFALGLIAAVAALAGGCEDEPTGPGEPVDYQQRLAGLELVVSGLPDKVSDLVAEPDGGRMLLLARNGRVLLIDEGVLQAEAVFDLEGDVQPSGVLGGLMSIALEPGYTNSGAFYISYLSNEGELRVERLVLRPGMDVVDPADRSTVIAVPLPGEGAAGGALAFGPQGMLYVGIGDGGTESSAANAQDLATLPGSLLRLDVRDVPGYSIPDDNPFLGDSSARPEIWASGLADPRSVAFHGSDVYVIDSGRLWHEVNVLGLDQAGGDFGWPAFDGSHCIGDPESCSGTRPAPPTLEYGPNSRLIPMPGEVYRGSGVPGLDNHFIWSDLWSGSVMSFRYAGGVATEHTEWLLPVRPARWTGFTSEPDGGLLVMGGPNLYRIVAP